MGHEANGWWIAMELATGERFKPDETVGDGHVGDRSCRRTYKRTCRRRSCRRVDYVGDGSVAGPITYDGHANET